MNQVISLKPQLNGINRQINRLEAKIGTMKEQPLYISRVGAYYSWKTRDENGNIVYIPKQDEALARELAVRKLYDAQLHDLKKEAEACRRYERYLERSVSAAERLLEKEPPEFRRLLGNALRPDDERIRQWEEAPYEKSKNRPEELIHPTLKENEMVRSKFEAMFSVCLKSLMLPYQYEKILHINEWEIAADFTVLDVREFREVPVELFGMMDRPDYRRGYERKMKTYTDGGYIPGVNMLTFFESSKAPMSQAAMMEELERFFFLKPPVIF